MESKAYEYMDWPRIEAVVYGEESIPEGCHGSASYDRRRSDPGIFPGGR